MPRSKLITVIFSIALAIGCVQAPAAASVQQAADSAAPAQTVVHMLDYLGVDYPGAVENGRIKNQDEFKEMVEFGTQIVALLKSLPARPEQPQLVADAEKVARMIQGKSAAADIAAASGTLRWAVIGAYRLAIAPKGAPDLRAGARLYQAQCAACHGAGGKGDGPAGVKLDPR